MSCAKSVLPMFTGDSSEKLRIAPGQVQIDTTHFRPQALTKSGVSRTRLAVNRTAVSFYRNSLFQREIPCSVEEIPCSARKNSLFRLAQGICLQSIEIAKKFPLLRITGNLTVTHWNDCGNWRPQAPNRPRIFKIPC